MGFFGTLLAVLIDLAVLAIWIYALVHLFSDRHVSGWGKAGWLVIIIVLPILGSVIYLATRPPGDV
jgi:uncharacterized membrane protein